MVKHHGRKWQIMTVTYTLTRKELGRANRQHLRTHPKAFLSQYFFLVFVIIQPAFIRGYGRFVDWGVMVIWFVVLLRNIPKTQRKTLKRTVTLLESGVQIETQYYNTIIYWSAISDVTFTEEFVSIYVDRKVEVF